MWKNNKILLVGLLGLLAISSAVVASDFKPALTGCKYQTVTDFKFSTTKPIQVAKCYIRLPEAGLLRKSHVATALRSEFGIMEYSVRRKNNMTLDIKFLNKHTNAMARYRVIGTAK